MVTDTQTREWTKDNQTKRIKEWLKSGKTLTSIQAYDMWGCTRLASRIIGCSELIEFKGKDQRSIGVK